MIHFLQEGTRKIIPSVEAVKERLTENEIRINEYINHLTNTIADYTPRIISSILVLFIGLWLINRIARLAEKSMVRRDLDISLRTFLRSLVSIGLKIILVVTVAGMVGIGTASFVTILGAAGLAIGLALQGSLSNFAGGVLILIFKPFRVGDTIEAGGQTGEVLEIQIFNTILLTGDHKTVILPNGPLSNGTIVNTTRHGDLRIEIVLTISNDNDLDKVRQLIMDTMTLNDKILRTPKPGVFTGKVTEGTVTIFARPYCYPSNASDLMSELYNEIKTVFEQHKVKPAIQERIIHTVMNN